MLHTAGSVVDCLSVCVCLCVTSVSSEKTAEPVEMPFGGLTHVDPWSHVLDGVQIPNREGTLLRGDI